jgi:predicted alpha/beta hydrolase
MYEQSLTICPTAPSPAVVMVHALSAMKEMGLAPFAEDFAAAGFVTVVLDYRFFGARQGE